MNSYRYRLFEKLGVKSDVELAIMAIQHEIIDIGGHAGERPQAKRESRDRKGPLAAGTVTDVNTYEEQRESAEEGGR